MTNRHESQLRNSHKYFAIVGLAYAIAGTTSSNSYAQTMVSTQPSSSVMQLPASGRSQQVYGGVSAQQTTSQSTGADVVQPSVNVTGIYGGSVDATNLPPGTLRLSLLEAVKLGLQFNLGTVTAGVSSTAARAQRLQSLSQLLPQISANLSATDQQVNLSTLGLGGLGSAGSGGGGISIPTVPPVFHYVQAQANFNWALVNLTSLRNYQAAKETERATAFSGNDARELVVLAVGGTYLQALSTAARITSQRVQVSYAQAIYDQAIRQSTAGTNTRIDVSRSLVQLQTEQERLISYQADYDQQKLTFARALGLPLDREIVFTEPLRFDDGLAVDEMGVLRAGFEHRWDLRAAETQIKAAEKALSAARSERFPTLAATGYYGADGPTPTSSHGFFEAQGNISMPIFDGGKIKGDVLQAQSTLRQRQAEYQDRKNQIEQDIRNSLIQLRAAIGEVKLAESNRQYALETLDHARRRFDAGVTNTVEVVQAQQQQGSAESDYIAGLFAYNLARLSLARATGQAETNLSALFAGARP